MMHDEAFNKKIRRRGTLIYRGKKFDLLVEGGQRQKQLLFFGFQNSLLGGKTD
jgi:hypothetical protein